MEKRALQIFQDATQPYQSPRVVPDTLSTGDTPANGTNNPIPGHPSLSVPPESSVTSPVVPEEPDSGLGATAFGITALVTALFFIFKKVVEGAATRAGEELYDRMRGSQKGVFCITPFSDEFFYTHLG